MAPTRRALLTAAGVGGASFAVARTGLASTSPSSTEQTQPRIAIVGAGLAGLACADRLRLHGVRAQLYEARPDRIGGRCWSSRGWADGQVSEHGGEFIDTRHTRMRALATRFGLTLDDTYDYEGTARLWLQGKRRYRRQFNEDLRTFRRRIVALADEIGPYHYRHHSRQAREIDDMTAREVVEACLPGGADSIAGRYYRCYLAGYLGLDLDDLGGLAVVDDLGFEVEGADERYHVHGGNDQIVEGLAAGLPHGTLRLDSPLESVVRSRDGRYRLRFAGSGSATHADVVVFCLPFTCLRRVDLDGAGLSPRKRHCIDELGMGTNAKVTLQFAERPVGYGGWNGLFVTDRPVFQTWESSAGQPGTHGLVTAYFGGRSDETLPAGIAHGRAPTSTVDLVLACLRRHGETELPGLRSGLAGRVRLDRWTQDPWSRGSYAAYLPGQYTRFAGFVGVREGALHFAGEHTSPLANQGYLEGAVRSGERAAREILHSLDARYLPRGNPTQ